MSTGQQEQPRIEVAMVPASSPYAKIVRAATERAGANFVPVDLASPADVAGRILVVDLTRVMMVQQALGDTVIAISPRQDLACFEVIPPEDVDLRLPRALRNLVRFATLRSQVREERETVQILNEIGASLSAVTDTNELLDRIVTHARRALRADGGSIYIVEEEALSFAAAQNDTVTFEPNRKTRPIDNTSLAGFVASQGELLRIDDLDNLPLNAPYQRNQVNDRKLGYRTKSALLVPMLDRDGHVLGVLALYNRKIVPGVPLASFDRVLPFTERDSDLARSIASQAAVALQNHKLYQDIRNLFDGFIRASVSVIEARDPATAGHSNRVAELTRRLAEQVSKEDTPDFRHHSFSVNELEELHYASLLHDFGKVGVSEQILLKADKLYPWELERIEGRFKLAAMQSRLEILRMQTEDGNQALDLSELDQDLSFIQTMNRPAYRFSDSDVSRLGTIQERWVIESLKTPVITPRDVSRLCIPRGSLDPQERKAIEMHVVHTYNFLKVIPWTRHLKNVPDLAHSHHEKLDGSGYPLGLRGQQIPYGARLMTIADIFDALVASDRPYKSAMSLSRAYTILRSEADEGHVEEAAVELFFAKELWQGVIDPRIEANAK
jgi:HD-GYP domain-containing protein (c-di-GMP phosphodiesterase class II)